MGTIIRRGTIDRHSAIINIFLVVVGNIIITNFLPAIGNIEIIGQLNNNYLYSHFLSLSAPFTACFWMGAVVAKDGLLDRLDRAMKTEKLLNPVIDVFIWCVIVYLRRSVAGAEADVFYVPILIVVSMDIWKVMETLSMKLKLKGEQIHM